MANDHIYYEIQPIPEKHLFEVFCHIPEPDPKGQKVAFPAWIPGSYCIREFAKHVIQIEAKSGSTSIPMVMLDKNTWICEGVSSSLDIHYQIYAYDLTPRGAHVDSTHAFFNGSRVFLQVIGKEQVKCVVNIKSPAAPRYQHWKVATSMSVITGDSYAFGEYWEQNYQELIDHPVEIGEFKVIDFDACQIPHEIVISGKYTADEERLKKDVRNICEYFIQFFGLPAPMKRYVFLLNVLNEGYGGLEHKSSSALHCRRENMPKVGELQVSEGYRILLGLFSHEYFHTWNVKSIKPQAFKPYDLSKENYTRQLWIFEGITSYYDDLALVRSKLISKECYLEMLGRSLTALYATPGRFNQTLEQSSFEAWTKFYKPDENALNAHVSYYLKGSIVALALDLLIRKETENACTLDHIMRFIWTEYGSTKGLPEGEFEKIVESTSGCNLQSFFDVALRSTKDFPLEMLFEKFGLKLCVYPFSSMEEKGGKLVNEELYDRALRPLLEIKLKSNCQEAQIVSVLQGSAAEASGLAPFDVIIAVNGQKVDRARLESTIAQFEVGEEIEIHAFRRDELMRFKVLLKASSLNAYGLKLISQPTDIQRKYLDAWLN